MLYQHPNNLSRIKNAACVMLKSFSGLNYIYNILMKLLSFLSNNTSIVRNSLGDMLASDQITVDDPEFVIRNHKKTS